MRAIRDRLAMLVWCLVAWQLAGFAATSVGACCPPPTNTPVERSACCKVAAESQACPMHASRPSPRTGECRMTCSRRADGMAVLFGIVGIPAGATMSRALDTGALTIGPLALEPLESFPIPDAPPPRA